ncbi:MAG: SGNH/GDSL hydrolase family protein [Candidatus Hodarchaeales archaeon]
MGNISLLLFSAVISLFLLEIALRIIPYEKFKVETPNPERAIFWHFDPLLGWKHKPFQEGRFRTQDFDVQVKINAQGLRDRPYSYQRKDGVFRIIALGDSFTWGFGVEQDEIFTEIMEKNLRNIEVINMGVSGYSTDQEYLVFKSDGLNYNPHLILLLFFEDDMHHNTLKTNFIIYSKPKFSLVNGKLILTDMPSPEASAVRKVHYFLRTHSIIYNILTRAYLYSESGAIRSFRKEASRIKEFLNGNETENPFDLTFAILREMKALCEVNSARMVIVKVATHNAALEYDSTRSDRLAKFCQTESVPFINLAGHFQNYLRANRQASLQLPHDRHWNAEAHELTAEIISSYLKNQSLIPGH